MADFDQNGYATAVTVEPTTKLIKPGSRPSQPNLEMVAPVKFDFGSKFELGDWSSSGTPDFPYTPDYNYSYICQLQLTNGLNYLESGMPVTDSDRHKLGHNQSYSLYALTNIRLNKQRSSVDTNDLKWSTVKFYSQEKIIKTSASAQVQTRGHSVDISFKPAHSENKDQLVLFMSIKQPVGALEVSARKIITSSRDMVQFEGQVENDINSPRSGIVPSYALRAVCQKEK